MLDHSWDTREECSIIPRIIIRKESFWTLVSMMPFVRRNFSRQLAIIMLYNLPIIDVKVIGLNELGAVTVTGPDLYS